MLTVPTITLASYVCVALPEVHVAGPSLTLHRGGVSGGEQPLGRGWGSPSNFTFYSVNGKCLPEPSPQGDSLVN